MALLFPAFCLGCKVEGEFLCKSCFAKIQLSDRPYLETYGDLDGLIVACPYKGNDLLQKSIHAFKYDFVKELGPILGRLLVTKLGPLGTSLDPILCPVPLHKKRRRFRGFNQSEILAAEIQKSLGWPNNALLVRAHYVRPQMELTREDRLKNTRDAFKCIATPDNRTVLLVDDVATTLATLQSCAKELKKAGFKKVYGIVLARVD